MLYNIKRKPNPTMSMSRSTSTAFAPATPVKVKEEPKEADEKSSNGESSDSDTQNKKRKYSNGQWHAHKKATINQRPELNAVEQLILAKKTYKAASGKLRSPMSIHRDAYLLRNPDHGLSPTDLVTAIREDLIARI